MVFEGVFAVIVFDCVFCRVLYCSVVRFCGWLMGMMVGW